MKLRNYIIYNITINKNGKETDKKSIQAIESVLKT